MSIDPAYPPNQAIYTTPNVGAPPPYAAAAHNQSNMMVAVNPMMAGMGLGPSGLENAEWGTFSATGLDMLADQDSVKVVKLFNQQEAITFIDEPRRFCVTNDGTKQMFSLIENSETMTHHQPYRSFEIDAFDVSGQKAFTITRDDAGCCSYCCFCCACFGNGCKTKVRVKVGDRTIGSINQDCSFNAPKFTVYRGGDYDDEELLKIEGYSACCTPATGYGLRYPKDNTPSGNIAKKGPAFGGFSNTYALNFPTMASPELKALVISAVVLCDFRFYNKPMPKRNRRR